MTASRRTTQTLNAALTRVNGRRRERILMSLRIRTDTRTAYDAAYAAYRDAVLVRGRAVADAVAHNHDPASAAAATQAIIAACHAARAVEAAAFAVLLDVIAAGAPHLRSFALRAIAAAGDRAAEAFEDNLVAIYDSTVTQMTERSRP